MHKYAFAIAAAAALFFPISSYSQQIEFGPGGVRIDGDRDRGEYRPRDEYRHREGYRHRGGECAQLRWACRHKDELGEEGMGNCRRYRETCG
jgi:hypothetical protein